MISISFRSLFHDLFRVPKRSLDLVIQKKSFLIHLEIHLPAGHGNPISMNKNAGFGPDRFVVLGIPQFFRRHGVTQGTDYPNPSFNLELITLDMEKATRSINPKGLVFLPKKRPHHFPKPNVLAIFESVSPRLTT